MILSDSSRLARNEALPCTELDSELVFLSVETGDYLSLEGTAREIWDRLKVPRTVGDLIAGLAKDFDIDSKTCMGDTLPFLEELLQVGLLVLQEGNDAK